MREMIAQVAARNALASETVETVIERTGGVPLFVEELTRAVLESGSANLTGQTARPLASCFLRQSWGAIPIQGRDVA